MALTENRLRALKPKDKPYKVADHRGLYIEVTPSGGKLWRFRYRIGNVEKKLAIGPYPEINLKQARNAADAAWHSVAEGGDPAFEKRKKKIRDEFLSAQTFEAVAREYIEQIMVKYGLAQATLVKANYFLEQLTPAIGNRPIHEIEPFEVLAPLKRLEATGTRTAAARDQPQIRWVIASWISVPFFWVKQALILVLQCTPFDMTNSVSSKSPSSVILTNAVTASGPRKNSVLDIEMPVPSAQ